LGETDTQQIYIKICVSVAVPDLIMHAKFRSEIYKGYNLTGGQICDIPIESCMGATTE